MVGALLAREVQRTSPRSRLAPSFVLVAVLVLAVRTVNAATPAPAVTPEYDLKAAFLFNFAQFVDWPGDAFAGPSSPITIGVLGEDPFGATLDAIVAGETVHDRPIVVRRFQSVGQVDSCQILFVGMSETARLEHIAKVLGNRSILLVGESRDFALHHGIVGFELVQRRLRLQINLAAASVARLTISSKLLRQATIVGPGARTP